MKNMPPFSIIILCISLIMFYACTNSHDWNEEDDIQAFNKGPCSYKIVSGPAVFPTYMEDVDDLTYRIPVSHREPPFAAIIIEPGFFAQTTNIDDIQDCYASHGFLVIGVNNKSHFNLINTNLEPYKDALLQTIRFIVESNQEHTSKLFGLVDTASIGLSGHSMGGGGVILACDTINHPFNRYIKTAITMNPFGKISGNNIQIPILLLSSDLDSAINPFMLGVSSSPEDIYHSFQTVQEKNIKLFANFKDMDHNAIVDRNIFLNTSGNASIFFPTMVSWFKMYLFNEDYYKYYLDPTALGHTKIKSRYTAKGNVPSYVYNTFH